MSAVATTSFTLNSLRLLLNGQLGRYRERSFGALIKHLLNTATIPQSQTGQNSPVQKTELDALLDQLKEQENSAPHVRVDGYSAPLKRELEPVITAIKRYQSVVIQNQAPQGTPSSDASSSAQAIKAAAPMLQCQFDYHVFIAEQTLNYAKQTLETGSPTKNTVTIDGTQANLHQELLINLSQEYRKKALDQPKEMATDSCADFVRTLEEMLLDHSVICAPQDKRKSLLICLHQIANQQLLPSIPTNLTDLEAFTKSIADNTPTSAFRGLQISAAALRGSFDPQIRGKANQILGTTLLDGLTLNQLLDHCDPNRLHADELIEKVQALSPTHRPLFLLKLAKAILQISQLLTQELKQTIGLKAETAAATSAEDLPPDEQFGAVKCCDAPFAEPSLMGTFIGEGASGLVYTAADNENYVYKIISNYYISEYRVENEVAGFNLFYGPNSAQIVKFKLRGSIFNYVIKMKKIAGIVLTDMGDQPKEVRKTFLSKLPQLFDRMVNELNEKGIYQADLTKGNIIYDPDYQIAAGEPRGRLLPIDLYYSGTQSADITTDRKKELIKIMKDQFERLALFF